MEKNEGTVQNAFVQNVFGNLKTNTIKRNARRSVSWLLNKIKQANKSLKKTKPKIGGMYLYVYDAKTKEELPFWDASPLVVPVKFEPNGFAGINFHYIPKRERLVLFKLIAGMNPNRAKKNIRISYEMLLALSDTRWKFAYKRYLFSHLRSRLLEIERNDWEDMLMLPVANFQKMTQSNVYKYNKRK